MDTYFGVSPESASRSGLSVYSAGNGTKDWVLAAGATLYLRRSWVLGVGLHYARLFDEANDSPVVDRRGSANQFIGGLGVG